MNPYQLMIPQLLAGLVIVVIARWAVRQSRLEQESEKEEIAKRQLELKRYLSQIDEAAANPSVPARKYVTEWDRGSTLQIILRLTNPDIVADVAQVAKNSAELLAGLSRYEETIGGRGFVLTGARADRGVVVLNLTPKDSNGSKDRVKQIVEALNTAFDATDSSAGPGAIPNLGRLPADISEAHAVVLAV